VRYSLPKKERKKENKATHQPKPNHVCPRSIATVPLRRELHGHPITAHYSRMRPQLLGRVSSVAVLQTDKQKRPSQVDYTIIYHVTHQHMIGSRCPMSTAGVPFDSCQELNSHLITAYHFYEFSTSREGYWYVSLTSQTQDQIPSAPLQMALCSLKLGETWWFRLVSPSPGCMLAHKNCELLLPTTVVHCCYPMADPLLWVTAPKIVTVVTQRVGHWLHRQRSRIVFWVLSD